MLIRLFQQITIGLWSAPGQALSQRPVPGSACPGPDLRRLARPARLWNARHTTGSALLKQPDKHELAIARARRSDRRHYFSRCNAHLHGGELWLFPLKVG
jgi:hypothetical protein